MLIVMAALRYQKGLLSNKGDLLLYYMSQEQLKIIQPLQKIEVLNKSSGALKGSIGFVCGTYREGDIPKFPTPDILIANVAFIRSGKSGKPKLSICPIRTVLSNAYESDVYKKILAEELSNNLGLANIKIIDNATKNIMDLSSAEFIGYIAALSFYTLHLTNYRASASNEQMSSFLKDGVMPANICSVLLSLEYKTYYQLALDMFEHNKNIRAVVMEELYKQFLPCINAHKEHVYWMNTNNDISAKVSSDKDRLITVKYVDVTESDFVESNSKQRSNVKISNKIWDSLGITKAMNAMIKNKHQTGDT